MALQQLAEVPGAHAGLSGQSVLTESSPLENLSDHHGPDAVALHSSAHLLSELTAGGGICRSGDGSKCLHFVTAWFTKVVPSARRQRCPTR